jgi:hypothetical protein
VSQKKKATLGAVCEPFNAENNCSVYHSTSFPAAYPSNLIAKRAWRHYARSAYVAKSGTTVP